MSWSGSTGTYELSGLSTREHYTVEEVVSTADVDGYDRVTTIEYPEGFTSETGVQVSKTATTTVTVRNTYTPSSINLRLYKHDSTDESKGLGASFDLFKEEDIEGGQPKEGAEPIATYATDGTSGYSAEQEVYTGTYYLFETVAPDGYNMMEHPWVVEIDSTGNHPQVVTVTENGSPKPGVLEGPSDEGVYTLKVPNSSGATLPNAGGPGTLPLTLVGAAMVSAALATLVLRRNGMQLRTKAK